MSKRDRTDYRRTVELHWARPDPPSRGPKPVLSLARIVKAGVSIADRSGLEAVSMRSVADRLGFSAMSLYRHVPGKVVLTELMRDAAVGEPPVLRADTDWRTGLREWARGSLSVHHRHPWMLDMELRGPPLGPQHLRWLDAGLRILETLELRPADRLSVVMTVDAYVRGAARVEVGIARERRRTRASATELDSLYERVFADLGGDERFAAVTRAIRDGAFTPTDPPRDDFEMGLGIVLDGIASRLAPSG